VNEQVDKGGSAVVNNVIALFLLLGGALLSGAWALFAAELVNPSLVAEYGSALYLLSEPSPQVIVVSFGPVTLLALIGALALRQRDGALGALVVPLLVLVASGASVLVEALSLLAIGETTQSESWWESPAASLLPALTSLVGLLVILLAHRIRSGRLFALALVGWSFAFAGTLRVAIAYLFLRSGVDEVSYALLGWSLWWLLPALGIYFYARRAAVASDDGRARASIARIFGGLALVGSMLANGNLSSEEFPFAALELLGVSLLLVLLALRERAAAYLWPSAVGIIASLSVINATYFSETLGLSGALLVEGLILLGVGGATFALRSRLIEHARSND
jgi:hypothetical protein